MKEKFDLEYTLSTSPKVLFSRLSTPEGLSEWFADDVTVKGKLYTFKWEGTEEKAEMVLRKDNKQVRYQWLDTEEEELYFEFRLEQHELTGDVALMITDFAEKDDKEDAIDLWDTQIAELKHILGL